MPNLKFKNFATGSLAAEVASGASTLTLLSGQANIFPTTGPFRMVLWAPTYASPSQDSTREIIEATWVSGDSFSIIRAKESTTDKTWPAGTVCAHVVTAELFNQLSPYIDSTATIISVDTAINEDTTYTDAVTVLPGGKFTIASGKTLTINGPFSCGLFQCFDGDGSVVFGSGSVTEVYPEWWGATITSGINEAIDSIQSGVVRLSAAYYPTTSTITMKSQVHLKGAGREATFITPSGTFNCIEAIGASFASWLNAVKLSGFTISGAGLTGNGVVWKYCALRSGIADLYILSVGGVGLHIEGCFDHNIHNVEVRGCSSYGIHLYEKQVATDSVYEEVSKLVFDNVHCLGNASGGTQWYIQGGDTITFTDCKGGEGTIGLHLARNCSSFWINNWMTDGNALGTTNAIQIDVDFANHIYINGLRAWRCLNAVAANRGRNITVGKIQSVSSGGSTSNDITVGALFDGYITFADHNDNYKIVDNSAKKLLTSLMFGGGKNNAGTVTQHGNVKLIVVEKTVTTVALAGAVTTNFALPVALTGILYQVACIENINLVQRYDGTWSDCVVTSKVHDTSSVDVITKLVGNVSFKNAETFTVRLLVIGY